MNHILLNPRCFLPVKIFLLVSLLAGCSAMPTADKQSDQLLRDSYNSTVDHKERDYYVYLPRGYTEQPGKQWPVIFYLHGDGQRGDGKGDLDFVKQYGPLYEAWVQKRPLPFIIVAPQLHMFDRDKQRIDYIDNRKKSDIPDRLIDGVPPRPAAFVTPQPMSGQLPTEVEKMPLVWPDGWDRVERDMLTIYSSVLEDYRADKQRMYLSGSSYGGLGTWYMASRQPLLFAAIAPIVGSAHPALMAPIAKAQLPVWVFAGGRDIAVPQEDFYAGLNQLEALGHKHLRFTSHQDMGHDVFTRVFAGQDIYSWLLSNSRDDSIRDD